MFDSRDLSVVSPFQYRGGNGASGSASGRARSGSFWGSPKAYTTRVRLRPFSTELPDDIGHCSVICWHEFRRGPRTPPPAASGFDARWCRRRIKVLRRFRAWHSQLDVLDGLSELKIWHRLIMSTELFFRHLPAAPGAQASAVRIRLMQVGPDRRAARGPGPTAGSGGQVVRRFEELVERRSPLLSTIGARRHDHG